MAVLIASNLRKEISGSALFDGVSFKVERPTGSRSPGRTARARRRCCARSSARCRSRAASSRSRKGTRIALHDQRPPAASAQPLRDYVLAGTADLAAVEAELRELELAMAGGRARPRRRWRATPRRRRGSSTPAATTGATAPPRVVRGLGFTDDDLDRPLSTFSGGELTRASLARALASQPDLLLLDEPTNHLDIESIEWLEELLQTIDAAVILVAHDRWFLEAVTTAVLELDRGRSRLLPRQVARVAARAGGAGAARREGGGAAGRGHRAPRAVRRAVRREEHEGEAGEVEAEADRPASRRSRSRPGRGAAPDARLRVPEAEAHRGGSSSTPRALDLRAGDKELLHGASFALERGEHVALIGPNGAGKTTLLETMLGRREPDAGRVRLGHGVEAGVLLPARGRARRARLGARRDGRRDRAAPRPRRRTLLGRFLFSGWEAHEKPVTALSGGERRRLALALVVASGANFLVLDEPTNHLDVESREALEAALEAFPGTVLLVTHDRALLDAVSGRLLAIEDGAPRLVPGGWAEYLRPPRRRSRSAAPKPSRAAEAARSRSRRAPAAGPTPLELVEHEIARSEERVADLERQLAEDWTNVDLVAAHRAARDDLAALLTRWERSSREAQSLIQAQNASNAAWIGRDRDDLLPAAVAEA